jgi:hypothetical protein
MRKGKDKMRREYDFSRGVRGKHAGQRFRVVGDKGKPKNASGELANKIQKAIERDIKTRKGFNVLWDMLDKVERDEIRAAWLERIDDLLDKASA